MYRIMGYISLIYFISVINLTSQCQLKEVRRDNGTIGFSSKVETLSLVFYKTPNKIQLENLRIENEDLHQEAGMNDVFSAAATGTNANNEHIYEQIRINNQKISELEKIVANEKRLYHDLSANIYKDDDKIIMNIYSIFSTKKLGLDIVGGFEENSKLILISDMGKKIELRASSIIDFVENDDGSIFWFVIYYINNTTLTELKMTKLKSIQLQTYKGIEEMEIDDPGVLLRAAKCFR